MGNGSQEMITVSKPLASLAVFLILALLSWAGWNGLETSRTTVRLETQLDGLSAQLSGLMTSIATLQAELYTRTDDRYRRADAEGAHETIWAELRALDRRLDAIPGGGR